MQLHAANLESGLAQLAVPQCRYLYIQSYSGDNVLTINGDEITLAQNTTLTINPGEGILIEPTNLQWIDNANDACMTVIWGV